MAVVEVLVMVSVIVAVVVVVSQSLSTELEMLETLWSCCQELTQRLKISDMAQTKNVDRLQGGVTSQMMSNDVKWQLCLSSKKLSLADKSLRHQKD